MITDTGNETLQSGVLDSHLVRFELAKILSSTHFKAAAQLSRFLEFVVERTLAGEADQLKEYRIGLEVYGRPASFDPRIDSVVRGEARRLRKKLVCYYESEGLEDSLRITIPKGGYSAVFAAGSELTDTTDSDQALPPLHEFPEVSSNRHRMARGKAPVFLLAGILAVSGWYAHSLLANRRRAFENISVQKITRSGKATLAAISPDGNYVLSALSDDGLQSLWLRNLPSGSDVQVVPPEQVHYRDLQFSRDGNYLYFVRTEDRPTEAYLYRAPLLGGEPQRLIADVGSNVSFSPDGKRVVFALYNSPEGQYRLVTASVDGTNARDLATGPMNTLLLYLAWSPDGKTIVCTTGPTGAAPGSLLAIDIATGVKRLLFKSAAARLSRPVWLPNGTGILVLSSDQSSNFAEQQIVLVSYPQGKLYPVTRDTNSYSQVSISGDGHTLVTVLAEAHWNLFVTQPGSDSEAQSRQLTADASVRGFSWTRDNKLIIAQDSGLSLVDPTTGGKFALTIPAPGLAQQPSACPDGRTVFVLAGPENGQNIWRKDANGTNLKALTIGRSNRSPVCSADGQSVFYEDDNQNPNLRAVPLGGGESRPIGTRLMGFCVGCVRPFDISPDGKRAAFMTIADASEKLVILDLGANSKSQLFGLRQVPETPTVRFAPGGGAVVFQLHNRGVDNLWVQRLDDTGWSQLTTFRRDRIRDFQFSPDGSQLAVIRAHSDSDAVLIRDIDR